jgi:hypothetical protein
MLHRLLYRFSFHVLGESRIVQKAKQDGAVTTPTDESTEKTISAEGIAAIREFWTEASTNQESSRINSAAISYMERIVLIAGGTLTLMFTVLGNLSGHLYSIHRNAAHAVLTVAACWLLITSMIFGLVSILCLLHTQRRQGAVEAVGRATMKLKLKLLERHPNPDLSTISDLSELLQPKEDVRMAGIVSMVLSQVALVSAFICLVLFVQSNLPILLNPVR